MNDTTKALKAVAAVLNNQLRDARWRACEAINRELEVRGIRLALFDHGGVVDVGNMPPDEQKGMDTGLGSDLNDAVDAFRRALAPDACEVCGQVHPEGGC